MRIVANFPGDYCPARIQPRPVDVPAGRQLRIHVDQDGELTIAWLDPGGGLCVARAPAGRHHVRQAGCACVANPRLLAADLS